MNDTTNEILTRISLQLFGIALILVFILVVVVIK